MEGCYSVIGDGPVLSRGNVFAPTGYVGIGMSSPVS
jgi:hypothetical protein